MQHIDVLLNIYLMILRIGLASFVAPSFCRHLRHTFRLLMELNKFPVFIKNLLIQLVD